MYDAPTPSPLHNTQGTLASVRQAVSDTADIAADGARRIGRGLSDDSRELAGAAMHEAVRAGDKVRHWLDRQGDMARHAAGKVRTEAALVARSGERYVRDEPLKSVLIAAGAGALATALLMMLRRRDG